MRFHVEAESRQTQAPEALTIDVAYDRTRLAVDDRVTCTASIKNNLPSIAPMVIVDLPIPGGFTIERGELAGKYPHKCGTTNDARTRYNHDFRSRQFL